MPAIDINIGAPKKKTPKQEKEYCCPCHWYGPRSEAVVDGDTVHCPCCGSMDRGTAAITYRYKEGESHEGENRRSEEDPEQALA